MNLSFRALASGITILFALTACDGSGEENGAGPVQDDVNPFEGSSSVRVSIALPDGLRDTNLYLLHSEKIEQISFPVTNTEVFPTENTSLISIVDANGSLDLARYPRPSFLRACLFEIVRLGRNAGDRVQEIASKRKGRLLAIPLR